MKLSDLSIKRPVFASMMSHALVLFGTLGYQRLTVRELPDIDPPSEGAAVRATEVQRRPTGVREE